LSAHIVLNESGSVRPERTMDEVKKLLSENFQIEHTTIQFEDCPCLNGQGGCN
jgi:Co/Zn/Cd efflux system component